MTRFGSRFPLGTMAVNVTGSFLIGLANVVRSVAFSYAAVWLGALVGRR